MKLPLYKHLRNLQLCRTTYVKITVHKFCSDILDKYSIQNNMYNRWFMTDWLDLFIVHADSMIHLNQLTGVIRARDSSQRDMHYMPYEANSNMTHDYVNQQ